MTWKHDALKALARIPQKRGDMIRDVVHRFAAGTPVDVVKLEGRSGRLRLRCGDWRVLIEDSTQVVDVVEIGSRGEIYSKKYR